MELMAIKLHRRLLNSTNGGVVHMHHGSYSFESQLIGMVVIAVFVVPVLILLVLLLQILLQILGSWAARVVREAEAAEAAAVMEAARAAEAAAAQEAALAARSAAVVAAGLKKHESCRLPTAVYKLDRDGADCECTICLSDFVDGEMVRVLPCSHRFHVGCIDKWLVSQVSCPNCRISLLQHVIKI